jgi:hypothetical protein
LGEQRRDGEGYALRDGEWRGRIEALCTVGLAASALVQKRSVRRVTTAGSAGTLACRHPSPNPSLVIEEREVDVRNRHECPC